MPSFTAEDWFRAVDEADDSALRAHCGEFAREKDESGETALMRAVRAHNYSIVKILLYKGSGVTNASGLTALMIAAVVNDPQCCRALVAKESHLLLPDGRTPLMLAAAAGCFDSTKALMPYYAGKQDGRGRTAQMYAAEAGHLPIVELLQPREGCLFSNLQETALSLALANHHRHIVDYLHALENVLTSTQPEAELLWSQYSRGDDSFGQSGHASERSSITDSHARMELSDTLESNKALLMSELHSTNLELKSRIGKLHVEASDMMKRNTELSNENRRLCDLVSALRHRLLTAETDLKDEQQRAKDFEDRADELTKSQHAEFNDPQHDPRTLAQNLRDRELELIDLRTRLMNSQAVSTMAEELERRAGAAEAENRRKDDEIDGLRKRLAVLDDLVAENKELRQKIQDHDQRLVEAAPDDEISLQEENRNLNDLVAKLQAQVEQVRQDAARLAESNRLVSSLQQDVDSLRTENDEMRKSLQARDQDQNQASEEPKLQDEINEMEVGALRRNNQVLREKCEELEAQIADLRSQLHAFEDSRKASARNLADLEEQLRMRDESITLLNDELRELREHAGIVPAREMLAGELNEKQKIANGLKVEAQMLGEDIAARRSELSGLETQLEGLMSLQEAMDRIRELEEKIEERGGELQELKALDEDDHQAARIVELEQEVEALTSELKHLHDANAAKAQELHTLHMQIVELTRQNDDLEQAVSGHGTGDDARVAVLDDHVETLRNELAARDNALAGLGAVRKELEDAVGQLAIARERIENLERKNRILDNRVASGDAEVRELRELLAQYEREGSTEPGEQPLAERVRELEDRCERLQGESVPIEEGEDADDYAIQALEDELRSTRESLQLAEKEIAVLQRARHDDEHKISELKKKLDVLIRDNDDLQSSIDGAPHGDDARVRVLDDSLEKLRDELARREEELAKQGALLEELKCYRERCGKLEAELHDLQKNLIRERDAKEAREKDVAELRDDLDAERVHSAEAAAYDIEERDEEIRALEAEVRYLHLFNNGKAAELVELRQTLDTLQRENEDLRQSVLGEPTGEDVRVAVLQQEVDSLTASVVKKDEDISRLQQDLNAQGDAMDRLARAQQELADRQRQITILEDRINALNSDVCDLRSVRDELERDNASLHCKLEAADAQLDALDGKNAEELQTRLALLEQELVDLRSASIPIVRNERGEYYLDRDTSVSHVEEHGLQLEVPTSATKDAEGERVRALTEELDDIRRAADASSKSLHALNETLREKDALLKTLEAQVEDLNGEVSGLRAELEDAQKQLRAAQDSGDSNSGGDDKATDRDDLIREIERLTNERRRLSSDNLRLETDRNVLTDKVRHLEGLLAEKEKEKEKERTAPVPTQEVAPLPAPMVVIDESLNERVNELERERGELVAKLSALVSENDALRGSRDAAEQDRADVMRQLTSKLATISELVKHSEGLEEELQALQRKLAEAPVTKSISSGLIEGLPTPTTVQEADDQMKRLDRLTTFVAGLCMGASMTLGAGFIQRFIE
ncbi:Ankyrin repeat protein 3 [Giardia muris]|uniref:Ankyrin repeat protein 3 n=1 Tax=Giardia muris TaxID=5742 RepID=A0A4Z1T2L4_GIAMU|nr:Ankyrin repeat protein 3 [Giardia muris]|eukprot:TNJ27287.1 Ankyrin repeat protein 3 [Giardia muris]